MDAERGKVRHHRLRQSGEHTAKLYVRDNQLLQAQADQRSERGNQQQNQRNQTTSLRIPRHRIL